VQTQGIPAAGAPAPARAAAQPEAAIAATRSTNFRAALGDVTLRRESSRRASAERQASRAAPTRAKPVVPKNGARAKPRGSGRSDQCKDPADAIANGERGATRSVAAKPTGHERGTAAEDTAPAADGAKETRNGAPARDEAAFPGAEAAAALAASAVSGQCGTVAAAGAAAEGEAEPTSQGGPRERVGSTATIPAVERETAEASTADDEHVAADARTGATGALPEGLEALAGLEAERDGEDGAEVARPAPAARPVGLNAAQGDAQSDEGGDPADAGGGSGDHPGLRAIALAAESPSEGSADATELSASAYARTAEPHATEAADAPAPLLDPTRASAAPDARRAPAAPPQPPEVRFAEVNHAKLITAVRGELLPDGGSMQIRLDPPELGDLLVSVELRAGVVTASFQTSNDTATRLLSHSLADLKGMLEQQGVTVDRLQVRQSPRDESSGDAPQDRGQGSGQAATAEDRHSARRDQHRRDLVQKMWDKLAGRDPLDLVA
jgi:flagellar hook-length control protein FliK